MGSSFVTESSFLRIRIQPEGGGQAPPWQGHWCIPSPLSPSTMCTLSPSPSSLSTYAGLVQFRGFVVQGAVSLCLCPGHPKPFCYLLGLWERTPPTLEPTPVLHTAPMPQPHADVPSWGHKWSKEGSLSLRAAKGSGQRRH